MPERQKTQYYTAATLDGFIAGPDHDLDWLFQFGMEGTDDFAAFIEAVGAVAMGASTYEWLLRHLKEPWPYGQPAWVFSHRALPAVPGADIRFVQGDVAPVHREMLRAAGGRNVWIIGGGDLVGQ